MTLFAIRRKLLFESLVTKFLAIFDVEPRQEPVRVLVHELDTSRVTVLVTILAISLATHRDT